MISVCVQLAIRLSEAQTLHYVQDYCFSDFLYRFALLHTCEHAGVVAVAQCLQCCHHSSGSQMTCVASMGEDLKTSLVFGKR